MQTMQPIAINESLGPRTIVLCFDGTGNKFGENSNVVRLFRALVKEKPNQQIVYYQPGIGTYNKRQFLTRTVSTVASALDKGIALHLNDHVKEGYKFIMKNYRQNDKICLFGFSRGAHTARVVAGMLYKVGLLPAHNDEQLDFAFSIYQTTGRDGIALSKEFKRTFAIPVTVEFVGVWDTVSSVGIIPRSHPYTSVNYAVKTFRHALALDERRVRFRPQTWNEPTIEREQDLDVDDPDLIMKLRPADISRDEWIYQPPDRTVADVKEVWFAGAHADVGGGSHHNGVHNSLSYIPLRWMIKECLVAGTGILFDPKALSSIGFDFKALEDSLANELLHLGLTLRQFGFADHVEMQPVLPGVINSPSPLYSPSSNLESLALSFISSRSSVSSPSPRPADIDVISVASNIIFSILGDHPRLNLEHAQDAIDRIAQVWDQLVMQPMWWILEALPMLTTYQEPHGDWVRKRIRNFGQGRYIPFSGNDVLVHKSVEARINETHYRPAAFNWEIVEESGMLQYVS